MNAVTVLGDEAAGRTGFGRPDEHAERFVYARIGLVALWTGRLPADDWPA